MEKREAGAKIERLGITEKMAKLSETVMPQVIGHIEQAVLEEQQTIGLIPPVVVNNTPPEHDT